MSNEFEFSLISEQDLKQRERDLEKKIDELTEAIQAANQKQSDMENKLSSITNLIMPLLENLLKDPDKEYIYWKSRVQQVTELLATINKTLEND